MRIYLVRHSKAETSHARGDPYRCLTNKGKLRIKEVFGRFPAENPFPELILHSPYARAAETARLLALELKLPLSRLRETSFLTPFDLPLGILSLCRDHHQSGTGALMLVSHNPLMEAAAGTFFPQKAGLVFHTPSVLALEWNPALAAAEAEYLWMIHPDEFYS